MLQLHPAPRVITFDCYGTLVQWHGAVRDAARAVLSNHVATATAVHLAPALADRLREVAVARQQRPPFQDYKSILRSSLDQALAELGHTATPEDHATLLSVLRRIETHLDVPAALLRLRTRYQLAIISNTDDDLIADTVAAIGTPVDFVITAQQARAYKPDHQLFHHAHATMGVAKAETIHVGMGQFTDLKACHELGIRSVWIDRIGEPASADWPPDAVLKDLSGLPELLLQS